MAIDREEVERYAALDHVNRVTSDYVADYEFGDCGAPVGEDERALIEDAIQGLLSDPEFIAAVTAWQDLCKPEVAALSLTQAEELKDLRLALINRVHEVTQERDREITQLKAALRDCQALLDARVLADKTEASELRTELAALQAQVAQLREALELIIDCAGQEWQEANGERKGATDNTGARLWFVANDVIEEGRAALAAPAEKG